MPVTKHTHTAQPLEQFLLKKVNLLAALRKQARDYQVAPLHEEAVAACAAAPQQLERVVLQIALKNTGLGGHLVIQNAQRITIWRQFG